MWLATMRVHDGSKVLTPKEGSRTDAACRFLPLPLTRQAPWTATLRGLPLGVGHGTPPVDQHNGVVQPHEVAISVGRQLEPAACGSTLALRS